MASTRWRVELHSLELRALVQEVSWWRRNARTLGDAAQRLGGVDTG